MTSSTPLERAFELARTGEYPAMGAVKKQLSKERVDTSQLTGATLERQLTNICRAAQGKDLLPEVVLKRTKRTTPAERSAGAVKAAASRRARASAAGG